MSADFAVWAALPGRELTAHGPQGQATWTCTACSEPVSAGGWSNWTVTFDAPGVVEQGVVELDLPGPGRVPVFVAPAAGTADRTQLVATFTAAESATPKEDA